MRSGDREARRVWDAGLDALADLIARVVPGLLGRSSSSAQNPKLGEAVFLEPLRRRGRPHGRIGAYRLGLEDELCAGRSGRIEDWR